MRTCDLASWVDVVQKRGIGTRYEARLSHPLRKSFRCAGFGADVLITIPIRQGGVPMRKREMFAVGTAKPPAITFAFQLRTIVAAV
jgi:hypothetical protein